MRLLIGEVRHRPRILRAQEALDLGIADQCGRDLDMVGAKSETISVDRLLKIVARFLDFDLRAGARCRSIDFHAEGLEKVGLGARIGTGEAPGNEPFGLGNAALSDEFGLAPEEFVERERRSFGGRPRGRLGDADNVLSFPFESLTVRPMRSLRRVKVATDGELGWLDMPLHFRVAPEPLWLIRPDVAPELEATRQ